MKRLLIFSTLLLLIVVGCTVFYNNWQANQKEETQGDKLKQEQIQKQKSEAQYISNMIAQIDESQKLFGLVETKAKHQELKDLATRVLDSIGNEKSTLEDWQAKWSYGDTQSDKNMLPLYVTADEYKQMVSKLHRLTNDDFDKLFIDYLRIQILSDTQQSFKIEGKAKHSEVEKFAKSVIDERARISLKQSAWPELWGYVPPDPG